MKFLQNNYKSRSTSRRHKIEIWRKVRVNDRGYTDGKDTKIAEVWASVLPVSEELRVKYQGVSVAASHSLSIDGGVDVLETDKIKFGNRFFDVMIIKQVGEESRDKIIITQEIRPK
jgi:head-tail adaptor